MKETIINRQKFLNSIDSFLGVITQGKLVNCKEVIYANRDALFETIELLVLKSEIKE